MDWMLTHQEPSGDYAPGFPPGILNIVAMHVEGFSITDPRMARALQALERHMVSDQRDTWFQTCTTPGWDTPLMTLALLDSRLTGDDAKATAESEYHIDRTLSWLKASQKLSCNGDWRMSKPQLGPGGFVIQYGNSWNEDVDDTAIAIIAFVRADPLTVSSDHVFAAVSWILGMQNSDGGWGAFDCDNDAFYLNKIPFCDYENLLCDPSTPDVVGHVLEAFGIMLAAIDQDCTKERPTVDDRLAQLVAKIQEASARAIGYISHTQEVNGSWFGRWACNYVFGTSAVLCGLRYFSEKAEYRHLNAVAEQGLDFIASWQNEDGGWDESSLTYKWRPTLSDNGLDRFRIKSTASQTAWSVMGMLAYRPAIDTTIGRGVEYLLSTQSVESPPVEGVQGRSWCDWTFTATALPNWMMMKYEFYSHYWPMMALGRYANKMQAERAGGETNHSADAV